ncbi:MAG TPA: metal ABC transporter permease [Anaerolineaceae bacterium]|nr:metal ABC transporter permease [Anaerolineaceae bacterium]HQL92220.1 metal ABC transporter permease [Anaerolineaceae bacterium]
MKGIIELFSDYTFQIVALGTGLLGVVSGVLGTFTVLRRQSLLGDGISHAALPGVVIAFLLTGTKNTEVLLFGALIAGLIVSFLITLVTRYTRVKFDTALAVFLSVFFGLGLALLSYAQRHPNANQAGLSRFIYGQASTFLARDVWIVAIAGLFVLILVFLFWKELKVFTFDPTFAQSLGYSRTRLDMIMNLLLVVSIVIGLQAVGVILMSAMFIAPSVAARQWSKSLGGMVMLSAIFGAMSGVLGTLVSSAYANLPTGPVIVVCASIIAGISLLFAPGRGLVHSFYRRYKARKEMKGKQALNA